MKILVWNIVKIFIQTKIANFDGIQQHAIQFKSTKGTKIFVKSERRCLEGSYPISATPNESNINVANGNRSVNVSERNYIP